MVSGLQAQEVTVVNGIDTGALGGLRGMLEQHPEGGRATFYAHTRWQDGARTFNNFTGYRVDGQLLHQHERNFVTPGDVPVELGATDTAPAPGEQLMGAVGSCIAATANAFAALKGVKLTRLEVALETDLDLHGLLALDDQVRPGTSEMRVRIIIAGDANEATLREIAALGQQYSPTTDSVVNGVSMKSKVVVAT